MLGLALAACTTSFPVSPAPVSPSLQPAPQPTIAVEPARPACAGPAPAPAASAAGITSKLPVLTLASGLHDPDDILYEFETNRLLVGEHSTGRVAAVEAGGITRFGFTVPLVEGIVRIGDNYYVGDQANDRVLKLSGGLEATPAPFFQLQPVRGLDGLDNMRSSGRLLLLPDSARGTLLVVDESGAVVRSVAGFARPVDAFALPDGSILVADENAAGIWKVLADGSKSLIARGLPLADDVVADAQGRIFTITVNGGQLIQIGLDGAQTTVGSGFRQPQGLEIDHAGNLFVTDFSSGRLLLVVESFKAAPVPETFRLQPGQPICLSVVRAPGFDGAVVAKAGRGYRVLAPDQIIPDRCAQPECTIQVSLTSGALADVVAVKYTGG